jgi:hypothetical protein
MTYSIPRECFTVTEDRYDSDILGIPGYWRDDGSVDLLASRNEWLRLPAGAAAILTDICARRSAALAAERLAQLETEYPAPLTPIETR